MDPQTVHQAAQVQVFQPFMVAGNMLWNMGLIGALGFMIRLWMKTMENKVENYCTQNREDHNKIFSKIENHGERIAVVEDRTDRRGVVHTP